MGLERHCNSSRAALAGIGLYSRIMVYINDKLENYIQLYKSSDIGKFVDKTTEDLSKFCTFSQ